MNSFTAISTDWRRYHGPTADYLGSKAPIYLSTAKTMDGLDPLLKHPEVKAILTNTGVYTHPGCRTHQGPKPEALNNN
jgi:hypothetical protein